MDIKQIKEYAPLIAAMARGEIVQIKNTVGHPDWTDLVGDNWTNLFLESDSRLGVKYRIKPTPKLRAWKAEEVPVGALIKAPDFYPQIILGVDDLGIQCVWGFQGDHERGKISFTTALKKGYTHSTDHGKTWLPCGIEE